MARHESAIRIACCLLLIAAFGSAQAARVREVRPLMGTALELIAEGHDEAALRRAAEAAYAEMGRLSQMMNHYDASSRVSAINAAAGLHPVEVPRELLEVLLQADRLSRRSRGAFDVTVGAMNGWRFRQDDPRVPPPAELAAQLAKVDYRKMQVDAQLGTVFLTEPGMRIDLGGIAKIYILEAGRRTLEARGVARALLNGGGDVVVHADEPSPPWRVGVRDPREPARLIGLVELRRGCVASSGDYERYFMANGKRFHHVLDPRTGYPAEGLRGVTLVSDQADAVNGLSVAVMVLGKLAGRKLVAESPGVDALIVERDGELWMSQGMRKRLVALPSPEIGAPPR